MANSVAHLKKQLNRTSSKKSHSWWWDSHISPKNSKWLAENLEEMDQCVKRMLKLIEEDGDSFAKKAEMYYQKRPLLISQVEEFYRVYRSLAERYDHVTGELRRNVASDLQSQGSGISEVGSESGSTWPSPDDRSNHRKSSGHRAAGFDVFLGRSRSNSDVYTKDGDENSSSLDSESESDDSSSINNYEDGSYRGVKIGNSEDLIAKIREYEDDLRSANEKILQSNEEITKLKTELQKNGSIGFTNDSRIDFEPGTEYEQGPTDIEEKMETSLESDDKLLNLVEELQKTKERLRDSEKEINNLKKEFEINKSESICHFEEQLELSKKDAAMWRGKLNAEKREVSKLHERIARYKSNLSDREQEIRNLKVAVSDTEQNLSLENSQLQSKISKLLEDQTCLQEMLEESNQKRENLEEIIKKLEFKLEEIEKSDSKALKELEAKIANLLEEIVSKNNRICEMEKHSNKLHMEQVELRLKVEELEEKVKRQRDAILEGEEGKREAIRQLCFSLEHYRNGYDRLRKAFIGHKRPGILAS